MAELVQVMPVTIDELAPLHVVPVNDLREHSTDSDKPCWCNPTIEDGVIVHNSMDGRELFETGERKPS